MSIYKKTKNGWDYKDIDDLMEEKMESEREFDRLYARHEESDEPEPFYILPTFRLGDEVFWNSSDNWIGGRSTFNGRVKGIKTKTDKDGTVIEYIISIAGGGYNTVQLEENLYPTYEDGKNAR
jgi:hypothetical protein